MTEKIKPPKELDLLNEYFVDKISPLLDAKVIQILLLRQTHDYTILRTEDTREINTVVIPESIESTKPSVKVAFLASKQKAAENRMFARFLRTITNNECYINTTNYDTRKGLCLKCPRCVLFGAVSVKSGKEKSDYNLKHRIEYSTAYSVEKYEDLLETLTFNAVGETDQKTGQSLNLTYNVKPLANFPSIVTLTSVTWMEFVLFIKTLMATKAYGAETRIKGDVRNTILGIAAGYEEIITALEYSLELTVRWENDLGKATEEILKKYANFAASRKNVRVLSYEETQQILEAIQDIELDKAFINAMQSQVDKFIETINKSKKKK